jgi:hypothetical protein
MKPHPIFVARHPQTGEFYASQDQACLICALTTAREPPHSCRSRLNTAPPRSAYWPGRTGLGHPARHLRSGHRHLRTYRRPRCPHLVPPQRTARAPPGAVSVGRHESPADRPQRRQLTGRDGTQISSRRLLLRHLRHMCHSGEGCGSAEYVPQRATFAPSCPLWHILAQQHRLLNDVLGDGLAVV